MQVVGVVDPLLFWLYSPSKPHVMHGQYLPPIKPYIPAQALPPKKHPSLPPTLIHPPQLTDADDSIVVA